MTLTPQEDIWVDAYCSNGFDRRAACGTAGYKNPRNYSAIGAAILKRPAIINAISERLEKKRATFFVSELDILEGLYKEAILSQDDGGTQQGRIAAWEKLGKYYGMWDNRVKELQKQAQGGGGTTINIMNYNVPKEDIAKYSNEEKDITPSEEEIKALEAELKAADKRIKVTDYTHDEC